MLGAVLEPPWDLHRLRGRRVDLAVEEGLGRGDREREVRARDDVDTGCATAAREALPLALPEHDDRSRRDDGELLDRDLLARLAEHVGVLERNVREHDDPGREDVRRVEPSSQPGLDDRDVDSLLGELGKGRRGDHLELRRPRGVGLDAGKRRGDVGVGSVDLDPLRPAPHVRRDVRARAKARVTEKRRGHQRRRGLPVRPDDVNRRVGELGVAEGGEQFPHATEAELLGPRREALEPPERVVSRRGPRAHGGTARASPAPPRRRPPGPSRRSARSRASLPNGRSPSSAAPAPPRPRGRRSAQSARA